jgi:hypothetical protein
LLIFCHFNIDFTFSVVMTRKDTQADKSSTTGKAAHGIKSLGEQRFNSATAYNVLIAFINQYIHHYEH